MRLSLLSSHEDDRPALQLGTWADLVEFLRDCQEVECPRTTRTAKGDIPVTVCPSLTRDADGKRVPNKCTARQVEAWSPAAFDGKGRSAANVIGMDFLVFDVDHATLAELTAIDAAIEREGLRAVLHSTHSHDPARDDYCVRIAFECSRSLLPHEITPTRDALQARLGFRADEQTKDASRIYYRPTRPKGGPEFMFAVVEGAPVDPSEATPVASPPAPVIPSTGGGAVLPVDMAPLRARAKVREEGPLKALMEKVLKGERLAEQPGRDSAIQSVAGHLAWKLPETPLEALLEIMRPSLMAMEPPDKGSWIEVAEEKLERARERWKENHDKNQARVAVGERLLSKLSAIAMPDKDDPGGTGPFDEARILQWAKDNGCGDEPELFAKQWIIRFHGANWIFCNGEYMRAVPDEDIRPSLLRDLARAPVKLHDVDKNGNALMRPTSRILEDYATSARDVMASISLQKSKYDIKEQVYHEAVCPIRRSLVPRAHPEILHWLELFGGDVLLDWVAGVTMLERPAAALYIKGSPGTGKNVLAHGLAKLWHRGGATDIINVIGSNFNDSLTRCPLIFADEGIPKTDTILTDLRRLIGNDTRDLCRKFMATVSLSGNPRLLITANNDRALADTGAILGPDDIAAVAQRIRIMTVKGEEAVNYLAGLRNHHGQQYIKAWVDEDHVAQCALWLRENRKINLSSRFLGSSEDPTLSEKIATGTRPVSAVLEFLARFLSDPVRATNPRLRLGDGRLLVNTELLADKHMWERYVPSRRIPSAFDMSKNLRAISHPEALEIDGMHYHDVKVHVLLNWSKEEQVGNAGLLAVKITGGA